MSQGDAVGIFNRKRPNAEGDPEQAVPDRDVPEVEVQDEVEVRGPAWQGRGLRLPAPPDAAHAAELATSFVDAAANIDGIELDYTIDSLQFVDGLLDRFGAPGSDAVAETVFAAGCYVGETLVRTHGYTWVDAPDELAQMFGFRLVVAGPGGGFANPIGKAFKLVENGPEDSVHFFAQAEIAAERRRSGGTSPGNPA